MQIFISYRREDSEDSADRIYERLSEHFGQNLLFMDIATIAPGVDFVEVIQQAVSSCDVLIAVIGRQWLELLQRRLNEPEDFVRLEIEAALERDIRVIPVLVQGASMPRADDLPQTLRRLARRQAIELRRVSWRYDMERLIAALEQLPSTIDQQVRATAPVVPSPTDDVFVLQAPAVVQKELLAQGSVGQARSPVRNSPVSTVASSGPSSVLGLVVIVCLTLVTAGAMALNRYEGLIDSLLGSGVSPYPHNQLAVSPEPTNLAIASEPSAQPVASSMAALGASPSVLPSNKVASPAPTPLLDISDANPKIVSNDQLLQAGNFQYRFSNASNVTTRSYGGARPSRGAYLVVVVDVANISDQLLQIPDSFFVLRDAQGDTYTFNRTASADVFNQYKHAASHSVDDAIPSGAPSGGSEPLYAVLLVFDVPRNATNLVLFSPENPDQGFRVRDNIILPPVPSP